MLKSYLKIAFKVLLRRKFFTFVSLFGICFTLVLLVVVAAFVDNAFGPRAPETKMDRSIGIFRARMSGERGSRTAGPGYHLLEETFRDLPGAEATTIAGGAAETFVYHEGAKVPVYVKATDAGFWRVFDFEFLEGGPYTAEDDRNAAPVAVINAAMRDRFFGGEPALGREITLDGKRYRVSGVVPNVPNIRPLSFSDVWIPLGGAVDAAKRKEIVGSFAGLVLAPSVDALPALRSEMESRISGIDLSSFEGFDRLQARPQTYPEYFAGIFTGGEDAPIARLGLLVLVLAFCVTLLPAVNLVNINLSRILERASEIGVRKAFGASSRTLVGQFLVENLVLTAVGGVLAFALSLAILEAVERSGFFPYADFRMSYRTFAVGAAATLFFAVLSGVYPAWRMSRLNPVEALRGRSS
jgi:putative ABC transport system permease protein